MTPPSSLHQQICFLQNTENDTSGRYANNPETLRGKDGAMAVILRIVLPACCLTTAALATRFWWHIPFTDRPGWLEDDA